MRFAAELYGGHKTYTEEKGGNLTAFVAGVETGEFFFKFKKVPSNEAKFCRR